MSETITMRPAGPARLVAFVQSSRPGGGATGPILATEGDFGEETQSSYLEDHLLPPVAVAGETNPTGLMLLEGWIEVTAPPDPDVEFVGEWRRLTYHEMCRLRFGQPPWEQS